MSIFNQHIILKSESETRKLAQHLATLLVPGDIVIFEGDLGSGKSFICREMIRYLVGSKITVTSPTFNLLQIYQLKYSAIYHYDLYRLKDKSEIYELAIEEALTDNITFIEWPEIILSILPENYLRVSLTIKNATSREVIIEKNSKILIKN